MNYEKAYKDALKRASKLRVQNSFDTVSQMMEHVFPELKESENERISREITEFLVDFNNGEYKRPNENTIDSWLSWLEKQDKQKFAISDYALREGISHFGITQYQIDNWLKKYIDIEKQGEQKLSWSEEDEKNMNSIINVIHGGTHLAYENEIDWLKSLKYRIKGE